MFGGNPDGMPQFQQPAVDKEEAEMRMMGMVERAERWAVQKQASKYDLHHPVPHLLTNRSLSFALLQD